MPQRSAKKREHTCNKCCIFQVKPYDFTDSEALFVDFVVLLVTCVALLVVCVGARPAFLPLACCKQGRGRGSEVRGCRIHVLRCAFLPLESTQLPLDNAFLPLDKGREARGYHDLPRGCRKLPLVDVFQVHGCRNHIHGCA